MVSKSLSTSTMVQHHRRSRSIYDLPPSRRVSLGEPNTKSISRSTYRKSFYPTLPSILSSNSSCSSDGSTKTSASDKTVKTKPSSRGRPPRSPQPPTLQSKTESVQLSMADIPKPKRSKRRNSRRRRRTAQPYPAVTIPALVDGKMVIGGRLVAPSKIQGHNSSLCDENGRTKRNIEHPLNVNKMTCSVPQYKDRCGSFSSDDAIVLPRTPVSSPPPPSKETSGTVDSEGKYCMTNMEYNHTSVLSTEAMPQIRRIGAKRQAKRRRLGRSADNLRVGNDGGDNHGGRGRGVTNEDVWIELYNEKAGCTYFESLNTMERRAHPPTSAIHVVYLHEVPAPVPSKDVDMNDDRGQIKTSARSFVEKCVSAIGFCTSGSRSVDKRKTRSSKYPKRTVSWGVGDTHSTDQMSTNAVYV